MATLVSRVHQQHAEDKVPVAVIMSLDVVTVSFLEASSQSHR